MTKTLTAIALVMAAASAAQAAPAPAAPAAARPAAAPAPANVTPPPGPAIPGVCVVSYQRAVAESSAGAAFQTRMQQLTAQVDAELTPERTTIQNDGRTLEGQRSSLPPDQFQQRAVALNTRIEAYQEKEQLRSQELEATRQKALQNIITNINPVVVNLYTQRNCAVVFEADSSLIAVNPAMDLTSQVIAGLNTRLPTVTFDRERINPTAAPAAAPAR
jgi:outer membrane protein